MPVVLTFLELKVQSKDVDGKPIDNVFEKFSLKAADNWAIRPGRVYDTIDPDWLGS